jgi:glutamate racemase
MPSDSPAPEIGVFDSGVGGLTVLRELRRALPHTPLRYVADTAYAPYGQRRPDEIRERSRRVSAFLIGCGARQVVVACNTATAHAVDDLRREWPEIAFVGTEPGVKPAAAASRAGRIGILATPATAASQRLRDLIARHAGSAQVVVQACVGVVELIETGDVSSPALRSAIESACAPLRAAGVDTVLLGCTHYPLVQPLIEAALGHGIAVPRVESAVAAQAARLWLPAIEPAPAAVSSLFLHASGRVEGVQKIFAALFGLPPGSAPTVQALEL